MRKKMDKISKDGLISLLREALLFEYKTLLRVTKGFRWSAPPEFLFDDEIIGKK